MEKASLVSVLKAYKEKLIIDRLRYKVLNEKYPEDVKILEEIAKFDTKKSCFGDYDFVGKCETYAKLAIYLEDTLIGYFAFCYSHPKDLTRFFLVICIKEEYQGKGIGKIVLNQAKKSLFENYNLKSMYATVLESNTGSINLLERSNFHKFPGYRENDYFQVDGINRKQSHYMYTIRDYKKERKELVKYRGFKFNK